MKRREEAEAALELTLSLENLSFAWATEEPDKRGDIFGYVAGKVVQLMGPEKTVALSKEINSITKEVTGRLLMEMKK